MESIDPRHLPPMPDLMIAGPGQLYDEDPGTTVWKRLGVSLLSLLPIEWLL